MELPLANDMLPSPHAPFLDTLQSKHLTSSHLALKARHPVAVRHSPVPGQARGISDRVIHLRRAMVDHCRNGKRVATVGGDGLECVQD
eukprot:8519598-Pyramimonas_sp.AAC.1